MEDPVNYGAVKANAAQDLGKVAPAILADRIVRGEFLLEEMRDEEDKLASEYSRRMQAKRDAIVAQEAEVREVAMELVRAMNAQGQTFTTYRTISPRSFDYNHYTWIFEVDEHNELTVRKAVDIRDLASINAATPRVEELGDTRVVYDEADAIPAAFPVPSLEETLAAKQARGEGISVAEATAALPPLRDADDAFLAPGLLDSTAEAV